MAHHLCPVCGFPDLEEPVADLTGDPTYAICPCCGTQFGADDLVLGHAELRAAWIADGAHWWSEAKPAPAGWSAQAQLAVAGFASSAEPAARG